MKIDRHDHSSWYGCVKRRFTWLKAAIVAVGGSFVLASGHGLAQSPAVTRIEPQTRQSAENEAGREVANAADSSSAETEDSHSQSSIAADKLLTQVIDRLANGKPFDCKVRQRVRTAGREVVGVGTYLQVGGGTGQFFFQMKMHDGQGKHALHQISDGRLAWTRSEISGKVALSRVDVGWLDEGARTLRRRDRVKPSMRVGGPSEILDTLDDHYDLKLGRSSLEGKPLLVVIGNLKQSRRDKVKRLAGGSIPNLYPTRVNVAIAQDEDSKTGFGKGLPVRIEHLSDPITSSVEDGEGGQKQQTRRQMISLLEFYSVRPITAPPIERFRFENQDAEVDFANETHRYEERFDIRVSAKERARYR